MTTTTMTRTNRLLAGAALAVTLSGCNFGASAAAAGNGTGGAAGVRTEQIADPSLDMNAVAVVVPANWHFAGVLMQGGKCVPTPFAVFRATSPDGLSALERQPTMGWRWGTGPMAASGPTDCLPLKGPLGAQAYLKYLASLMKVEYLADVPEPAEENALAQKKLADAKAVYAPRYAAQRITPPKETYELARALVGFKNGSFTMKGELRVLVDCTEMFFPGMRPMMAGMVGRPDSTVHRCTASARYVTAPEAKFAAVVALWERPGMGAKARVEWQQAWVQRNQQQADRVMARMREDTRRAMDASAQKFQHDMAVQSRMHQEFLATMQRGTDMSMARAEDNMNARSRATSDWVDYALDQQTVRDPATGRVSKVSSANSYTWIDGSGRTSYQTNDVNANPNGVLQGNWTKQVVTHGDGTQ